METGTSGLQLRVRDFVRKLRPERVRWQWRHLLATVDNHWPPSTATDAFSCDTRSETERGVKAERAPAPSSVCDREVAEITASSQTTCEPSSADRLMSALSQLPVASTDEELSKSAAIEGGNGGGSVRPNELSLGGGGLVPPASTPRNKSPVTVQEWVDSLPLTPTDTDGQVNRVEEDTEPRIVLTQDTDDNLTLGAEAGLMCGPLPPTVQVTSHQEPSESGSHCSSVESLLEARRADPEEVLLSLGFGGGAVSSECRIPQRFLQPSKLKGVAIDDFLRHQHEMVTNFETGFCGYRGLSGPSHTMPSVIVAKIMEKLREHERENCSVASPPHVSTNTDCNNRFSRAARNVITNLKSPGNSVLTPDNRAWLDSQNQRSPEVSRKRIIIGQQSFTFSRDGDLIESPPSSLTDSDRWTSSTGTPVHHKTDLSLDKPSFPSILEAGEPAPPSPPTTVPRHAFATVVTTLLAEKNQESKLSNSSMEARSVGDSGVGLPSSGRSSRGVDEFDSPINTTVADDATRVAVTVIHPVKNANSSLDMFSGEDAGETEAANVPSASQEPVLNQLCVPSLSVDETIASENKEITNSLCEKDNQPNSCTETSEKQSIDACSNEDDSFRLGSNSDNFNLSFNPSVSDRLSEKSVSDTNILEKVSVDSNSLHITELPNVHPSLQCFADLSTSCTSPFPSLASELEQVQRREQENAQMVNSEAKVKEEPQTSTTAPVRVIESLDKVIESLEKIMEPLEVITESNFQFNTTFRSQSDKEELLHSFEDLSSLAQQLLDVGVPVEIGSSDHFLALTVNERCELQCRLLRLALSSYQAQLAVDTSHYELKCCLGSEVTRLSDLLDTASDPDKLNTLVRQMTELLKHQAELSKELDHWTSQSAEAPGCHQLCEVVLRRLRALELMVHRNTRALSDLRNQVSH